MPLDISSGRIRLQGAGGATKFDSNDKMLVILDFKQGTMSIAGKAAGGQAHQTDTQTLATGLPAGSSHVFGVMNQQVFSSNYWYTMGGTTVLYAESSLMLAGRLAGQYRYVTSAPPSAVVSETATCIALTFYVSGTQLRVDVDRYGPEGLSWPQITVRWYAFVAGFDQGNVSGEKVFKADGTGATAIWADDANDLPFTSPTTQFNRLLFHSELENIGLVQNRTGTVLTVDGDTNKVLFAHGLGYAPIVFGDITIAGDRLPITGTAFYDTTGFGNSAFYTVGANSTHVVLSRIDAGGYPHGNQSVSYDLYLSNYGVSGTSIRKPPYYNGFEATTSRFRSGYFDSDTLGYLASTAATSGIPVVKTRTLSMEVGFGQDVSVDNNDGGLGVGFRQSYSSIGWAQQYRTVFVNSTYPGSSTTFNTAIQRLKVVS